MVGRSQHLLVPRASQDWHCCSHLKVPNVTVRPVGLRSAFGKLTASYFIDVEECLFINALPSFGVNRKIFPVEAGSGSPWCCRAHRSGLRPGLCHQSSAQGCFLLISSFIQGVGAKSHERKQIPSLSVENSNCPL